jgi:hypothetical protein
VIDERVPDAGSCWIGVISASGRCGGGADDLRSGFPVDALARIIPKLKIELGDRFLRVHGREHTYNIHIGSANIQIDPDSRYLCIVPRSTGRPKIMLPFDGDQVLTVIVSKAILQQLNPR